MADREHVALLKCSVCSEFSTKLESMRNFKPAFIDGSSNVRVSAVQDHATTDTNAYAMLLLKKQQSSSVKKFDISYMIAKEKLAFTKMKRICELEERHGVDLGAGYKNDHTCATFIAKEQLEILHSLSKFHFCSLQADASVDTGNVEL